MMGLIPSLFEHATVSANATTLDAATLFVSPAVPKLYWIKINSGVILNGLVTGGPCLHGPTLNGSILIHIENEGKLHASPGAGGAGGNYCCQISPPDGTASAASNGGQGGHAIDLSGKKLRIDNTLGEIWSGGGGGGGGGSVQGPFVAGAGGGGGGGGQGLPGRTASGAAGGVEEFACSADFCTYSANGTSGGNGSEPGAGGGGLGGGPVFGGAQGGNGGSGGAWGSNGFAGSLGSGTKTGTVGTGGLAGKSVRGSAIIWVGGGIAPNLVGPTEII